jgi:hypothetical protein
MLSNKQFFEQLREGDEYLNCFMTKEVYSGIDFELRERIAVSEVRQKNNSFENDETHKALMRDMAKLKTKIINYEYDLNHKTK